MLKDYEIAFKLQAQMNPQFRKSFRDANRQLEGMENVLKILQRAKGPKKAVDEVQNSVHGFAKARKRL